MIKSPIYLPVRTNKGSTKRHFVVTGKYQYKLGDTVKFKLIPGTQTTKTKTQNNFILFGKYYNNLHVTCKSWREANAKEIEHWILGSVLCAENSNLLFRCQRIIRCKHTETYRRLTSCAFTITLESLPKQKISFSQPCQFPSRITSYINVTLL